MVFGLSSPPSELTGGAAAWLPPITCYKRSDNLARKYSSMQTEYYDRGKIKKPALKNN
jgi:hypothetical protein